MSILEDIILTLLSTSKLGININKIRYRINSCNKFYATEKLHFGLDDTVAIDKFYVGRQ